MTCYSVLSPGGSETEKQLIKLIKGKNGLGRQVFPICSVAVASSVTKISFAKTVVWDNFGTRAGIVVEID